MEFERMKASILEIPSN